jgi:hypothetical protein
MYFNWITENLKYKKEVAYDGEKLILIYRIFDILGAFIQQWNVSPTRFATTINEDKGE